MFITPKVNLVTLNYEMDLENRSTTITKPIIIEDHMWIEINATILPGIMIGKNAIVASGSMVTKDVETDTIVGENPTRLLKKLEQNT